MSLLLIIGTTGYADEGNPVATRNGLFGIVVGHGWSTSEWYYTSGIGSPHVTFRPVIWNK